MELQVYQEFDKNTNYSKCNIGWNNFDPDVKNGYKFKPKSDWEGLYIFIYFKIDDKIILTTNNTLTDVKKIDEEFEKFFVKKRGTIDRVVVSDNFKILRYRTWNGGKQSEWIDYKY